jgi:hypothetical protein
MKFSIFLAPLFACLLLISCKEKKEHKLTGKWQEVAVINPELDEAMHDQQIFADTVGGSTTAEQNKALYGTDNVDTMRAALKKNLDSFRLEQYKVIDATRFDFRDNGILYINSIQGIDSANWYLDDEGALILDEAKLKGNGNKIRMEVVELSDTLLKLGVMNKFANTTAVFKPSKNKPACIFESSD